MLPAPSGMLPDGFFRELLRTSQSFAVDARLKSRRQHAGGGEQNARAPRYSRVICAFSGAGSAKRTPTPIRRTGLPVRANASASSERKASSVGVSPARSAVVRVKSLNFSFTKIFVISRVDSF